MITTSQRFAGRKILFATVPGEDHVNPLTSIAKHLQQQGCDIKWYTFAKSQDISAAPKYYEDMLEIRKSFPFELLIADSMFTGIPFVKEKMKIPAVAVGTIPLSETSKDLAPYGLGLTPANGMFDKFKHALLRFVSDKVLMKKSIQAYSTVLKQHGIYKAPSPLSDFLLKNATLVLQSGTPGFEYYRSDIGHNIRFIGPLLPYAGTDKKPIWFDKRLKDYKKILLVTQGTVETNMDKLIRPVLEAFKDSNVLVIATTGGAATTALKEEYPHENLIIEDFIPFADVMPYACVFVTNGGYAGVLLSIRHRLPILAAGVDAGKNEICSRIGFFKYGINLNTETPTPEQIKHAVTEILTKEVYTKNVKKLSGEFELYNPNELTVGYIGELLNKPL
jgi:UDP:flavonoid glycosyltransferase YjiC (YdhE family)